MLKCSRKKSKAASGFTLIEVLVAMTILLLVILPLASLYVKSLGVIQNAALYSQAIQLAQERMEVCEVLDYNNLEYYDEVFSAGFPYAESPLPPSHRRDANGATMDDLVANAYDNRDNPDTDGEERYFDPTGDDNNENYPVPIYRDYYNNYTGLLLDPNFNGLCDDDMDGDGLFGILANPVDMDDIEIATVSRLTLYSDPDFSGTPAATLGDTWVPGDGLFDTIVEGSYIPSMDPMYRQVRTNECISPILDYSLLLDNQHIAAGFADYRHREQTFRTFVRMTSFIDPTPRLGNPRFTNTWLDSYFMNYDAPVNLNYDSQTMRKMRLCLERDLPLLGGYSSWDVGVLNEDLIMNDNRVPGAYTVNYTTPVYGIKIIVNVFYLTGEGEVQLVDFDGDGVFEEMPLETYGAARRIRLERVFYNDSNIDGFMKEIPPPRWFYPSDVSAVGNPSRSVTITDIGLDLDPCSLDNDGLPYLY